MSVSAGQTGKGEREIVPLFASVGAALSADTEAPIKPCEQSTKRWANGQDDRNRSASGGSLRAMAPADLTLHVGRHASGADPDLYEAARPDYPDAVYETLSALGVVTGARIVEVGDVVEHFRGPG